MKDSNIKPHTDSSQATQPMTAPTSSESSRSKLITMAVLLATLAVWSSSYTAIHHALSAYTAEHVAVFRYIIASGLLLCLAPLFKVRMPALKDLPLIFWCSFLGISLYNVCLCRAELTVSAGTTSLIIAMAPMFTAVVASFMLKEKLQYLNWLGFGVSFGGVALISLAAAGGIKLEPGVLLVLAAAIVQGIAIVLHKKLMTIYKPMETSVYTVLAGTLSLLPFFAGLTDQILVAPSSATLAVAYLGLVPGGVGLITWAFVLSRSQASTVASSLYLVPFMAVFIAWHALGEIPAIEAVIGGLIILLGVRLSTLKGKPAKSAVGHDIASRAGEICSHMQEICSHCQPCTAVVEID